VTSCLQDWPPDAKLAESHPKLYQDFSLALPIPEYTRRDGFYNLAAHYPTNCRVQPDLGTSNLCIKSFNLNKRIQDQKSTWHWHQNNWMDIPARPDCIVTSVMLSI
jgi:hypothetical protein